MAAIQQQQGGYGGGMQQQQVVIMQPGAQSYPNQGQPQNIRDWSTGICGCCEDIGTCKYRCLSSLSRYYSYNVFSHVSIITILSKILMIYLMHLRNIWKLTNASMVC